MQHDVIKIVIDLRQVGGFLRGLHGQFPSQKKTKHCHDILVYDDFIC